MENEKTKRPRLSGITIDWEKFVYYLILSLALVLPLWVLPFSGATLGFSKALLTYTVIVLSSVFYLIYILQKGSVRLPKIMGFFALAGIVVATLISAVFSDNFYFSLFGNGSETATFVSVFILSLGLFLTTLVFNSGKRIFSFFFLLFCSSIIIFLFQLFHTIFGLTFLPWEVFTSKLQNLIGSWNEVAVFFGLIALEAVVFFEFSKPSPRLKKFFGLALVLAFVAMVMVNFTSVWVVFGVFLLVLLVYLYSISREYSNFARLPLFLILLVVFFVLAKPLVGDFITSLGLDSVEVRPSWSSTFNVAKDTMKEGVKNMVLGSGPNTFLYDWMKYKSTAINSTIFWNVRFTSGVGLVPSFLASLGVLGALAWLFFLCLIVYYGFKAISQSSNDSAKVFLMATFLGALYLWVFSIIYVLNNFLLALAFLLTGLFFAVCTRSQKTSFKEISFVNNSTVGFISALLIVLLMIVGVASFYLLFQKYWSAYTYTTGLVAFNRDGNLGEAEDKILRAIRFDEQDRYYRSLSEVGLVKVSRILNSLDLSPDEARAQFQNTLSFSVQSAKKAVDLNPVDSANWTQLGRVYESVIPLNIIGSSELALDAYRNAAEKSPQDPRTFLSLARVKRQSGDNELAREYLILALQRKRDYSPALYLLAQIEASSGNVDQAILATEQARLFAPNDIGILFQLGLLYYQADNFDRARTVFERAVTINPNYSNARYFLGLIYDFQGRSLDAIEQFELIEQLNPQNTEVKTILRNLKAGRRALQQISPPSPPPEEREELPLEEDIAPAEELRP